MQQDKQGPDIHLRDVRLRLGETRFHFVGTVQGGCITALIGPSGSGKSTLLNLIAGFDAPQSGKIVFGTEEVTKKHPSHRPVSLIFQDHNLFGHLDLFTNVGLGIHPSLKLSAEDRRQVSTALARVGLAGMEQRKPATLSGGEKQRAAFARALVRHKPVLLMDEPFAALDPGLRSDMAALLVELHRETGSTVLMVTHDPDEVERLSQRVMFVEGGRIMLETSVSDLGEHREIFAVGRFLRT
ncbi:thiamine transport system ATP-binding protein [Pseudorhizobium tarimense]|uniref:Thiamine transport system ATP-binding protein n=1 Tax=Pseudorhizobium tarimense TaxID=1079109 RepID=A0ABV2H804_9HYPH|nr:ATP-binding cassette domain-containing protein [Pseudorhizobium tarimense]MCJ8519907.1 ATP-binding cassette domain-containing protein [Pseudorhizobium tarimense]